MIWGCHYFWKHPDTSPYGSPQISFNPSIGFWFASSAAGFWHMACALLHAGKSNRIQKYPGFLGKISWFHGGYQPTIWTWKKLDMKKNTNDREGSFATGKDATWVASTPGCIYPTFLNVRKTCLIHAPNNLKYQMYIHNLTHKWESFCVTFLMILCRAEDCFQTSWNQTWQSSVPHCLRSERNTCNGHAIKPATLRVETGLSGFLVFGLLASFLDVAQMI